MHRRPRLLVLACVLASLLVPALASASIGSHLETRVGGLDLRDPASVRAERAVTHSTHQGYALAYDDLASGSLLAARGGNRVLLDSNVVPRLSRDPGLGGRLGAGDSPVVSYVTGPELQNAVGRSLKGVPGALDNLPVLGTQPSLNLRINIRGQLPAGRGRFGDGVIGAQAIEGGIPLITDDAALGAVVSGMGGIVR